jgi:hypothetical protein
MPRRTAPQAAPEVPDATIFFNGVDGVTGGYLRPPVALSVVARQFRSLRPDAESEAALLDSYGLRRDLDPSDLAQAGWGVVFARGTPPEIREALSDLLEDRKQRTGKRFRVLEYLPGETKRDFLRRHGAGPGPVDPEKVPYYLLLVGDPEAIPFEFQFHLSVQYAVGRLCLETLEDYRAYARNVATMDDRPPEGPQRAAFFAPTHPKDEATRLSSEVLARSLAKDLRKKNAAWEVQAYLGSGATRKRLAGLLAGGKAPRLLFTAGHGLGFSNGDDRQLGRQGALLCSDWPGPEAGWSQGLPDEWYFAGENLPAGANLGGMICFCFACHSAGTPRRSGFKKLNGRPKQLTSRAFVARLPQKLLAHGAHAVIGHVDQAWETSFVWRDAGAQLAVFQSLLWKLAAGGRVGEAMEVFGQRWAEIAADLQEKADATDKAWLWLAHNDARSYVLLGDPAVRVGEPTPCAPC